MALNFLKIYTSPDKEILELLNNNVIGTPGLGMLYQHLGVLNKIFKIAEPYYVCLVRNKSVVGVCCFCGRSIRNAGHGADAYYVRYFSFKDSYRRKPSDRNLTLRHSALRKEINSVLDGNGLGKSASEKFVHFAYVDPRNIRSAALCEEFGFEAVRQYTTIIFNRLNPKQSSIVTELSGQDEVSIRQLLNEFYKDYNMFSFENLFGNRKYYVVKDRNGKILAGVQANPDHWKILSLPGLSGRFLLNTFTHLPYLNRLISKDYRFITLEGVYYARGHEKSLQVLIESLLAENKVNAAIVVVDAGTQLYRDLKSLELGLLSKINSETRGNVICKFYNFDDSEKELFRTKPAYISGIDVT